MPTFREDTKIGGMVPMMKTDDYNDQSVTEEKLKDGAITTRKIADGSVTKDKLDSSIRQEINDSVTASNEATEKAKEATAKADQATENAKQATIAATAAKEAADTATQASTNATTASAQATEQAKAATTNAEESAAKANEAAQRADDSREQTEQTLGTMQEVVDKVAIKDEEGTLVETPFRYIQNEEFIFAKVDANDKLLFGIQCDGTPVFGKTSAVEDRLQSQVTLLAERVATIMGDEDTTNVIDTMNDLKKFFAEIENTETLTGILANLDNVAKNLDKTTIKDEEGNVQDTPFRVIENEEFIMAVVDSEDRVLFGIYKETGKPYYPQNDMYHISQGGEFLWVILDAANHPLLGIKQDGTCWAAKAQWLDDIKAIKESLLSIDETLKTFQPKEDGKGLINLDVADSFFYISNDEYIIAVVDAENRILAGIKYDAQPYFPNHEMYSVITDEEWLYAIIDAEDKVLGGFRADDGHMVVGGIDISTFIANAIIDIADIKERTAHLFTIINDEYLSIETDAEGKVIGYIDPDGSHYLYKVKSETIPEEFSHIEDPEGRTEITTDAEGKLLGYRDKDGMRCEHKMQIDELYKDGEPTNYASKEYVDKKKIDTSSINISELNGVIDNSLDNLFDKSKIRTYDSDFATKVFNAIGRKTNESGCYSNNIPCNEGDWFTRNDFGTGIVIALDADNNILGDIKNAAYHPTIQIKASEGQDFSNVAYVVMVVMLSNLENQKIVNAKYIPTEKNNTINIPKLKISDENIKLGITTFVKSTNDRYYKLSVDDSSIEPKLILTKIEGIPSSNLPSEFPVMKISGDFSKYYDSLVFSTVEGGEKFLIELNKINLVSRYINKRVNCPRIIKENDILYYYGVDGNFNVSSGKLNIYKEKEESFSLVKGNITDTMGELLEPHDCLVLSVNPLHVITQRYVSNTETLVDGEKKIVTALHVEEQYDGRRCWLWKSEDHPELWKDSFKRENNADYLHNNTINLDVDGNLILNNKHADQILIIERTWDDDNKVGAIGEIIWKIGGKNDELHKDSYDVPTRIKTSLSEQWNTCHDASQANDGRFTLFNNGGTNGSEIVEFFLDKVNKRVKNFLSYSYKKYCGWTMGSVERIDNGIYLVSWGGSRVAFTPNLGIYDFINNKTLFEISFSNTACSVYRVYGLKNK